MEVHAHTHHGKKKWTEYFWEFLMLFLAVFCGFLAENQREHMLERRRVKESMKGVVENLKYDTVRCRLNSELNAAITLGLDSFRSELKNAIAGKVDGNALYYYMFRYCTNMNQAVFNNSAITELKNSGSLRLVENKEIVLAMADYYERKVYSANDFVPYKEQKALLQQMIQEFFSLLHLDDYIQSFNHISSSSYANDYVYQDILTHKPALKLLNEDPKQLEGLYNRISLYETQIKYYNFWLYYNKEEATKLIKLISATYH